MATDPIIRAAVFAGHSYDPQTGKGDPGAVLKLADGRQIREAEINIEMRDMALARLPDALKARAINPDIIEPIVDKNGNSNNLTLAEAIALAKQSDTVPLEIHQNASGEFGSPFIHTITPQASTPAIDDFAKSLNEHVGKHVLNGVNPKMTDGLSRNPRNVMFPEPRGANGVIFEGNALYNEDTYNHYLANKEQIAQAFAESIAYGVEVELEKKIAANPELQERAYLDPSQQSGAEHEAAHAQKKTTPQEIAAASQPENTGTPNKLTGSVGLNGKNSSRDVHAIQESLKAHGYNPGPIDGLCGERTINAIKQYQAQFMKNPDGRVDVDGKTWQKLNAPELDSQKEKQNLQVTQAPNTLNLDGKFTVFDMSLDQPAGDGGSLSFQISEASQPYGSALSVSVNNSIYTCFDQNNTASFPIEAGTTNLSAKIINTSPPGELRAKAGDQITMTGTYSDSKNPEGVFCQPVCMQVTDNQLSKEASKAPAIIPQQHSNETPAPTM